MLQNVRESTLASTVGKIASQVTSGKGGLER